MTLFQLAVLIQCTAWGPIQAYSSSLCKNACYNMNTAENEKTCKRCALYPPTDFHMCRFACNNLERTHYIVTICDKCFARRPALMRLLCEEACFSNTQHGISMCDFCEVRKNTVAQSHDCLFDHNPTCYHVHTTIQINHYKPMSC